MLQKIDNCNPIFYKMFPGLFNIKYEVQKNGLIKKIVKSIINENENISIVDKIGESVEFPMGYVTKKKVLHSILWCPTCKKFISRDVNASKVIKYDKFMKQYFNYSRNKWCLKQDLN